MPWFLYLTPIGWIVFFLSVILFIHESGHFIVAYLTGHKITKFKVGLREPVFKFKMGNIDFEFSGDANGGKVYVDNAHHVSQIGILLTALAGPFATLLFGTGLIFLAAHLRNVLVNMPKFDFIYLIILPTMAVVAYWDGFSGIIRDLKNIIRK